MKDVKSKWLTGLVLGVAVLGLTSVGLGMYDKHLSETVNYDKVQLEGYDVTLEQLQNNYDATQEKFKAMQEIFDGEKEGSVVLVEKTPGWDLEVYDKDGMIGHYLVTTYTDKDTDEKVTRIEATDADKVVYAASEVVLDTTLVTKDVTYVVSKQMTKFTPTLKMDLESIEQNIEDVKTEALETSKKNYKWAVAMLILGVVVLAIVLGKSMIGTVAYWLLGATGLLFMVNVGVIGAILAHIMTLLKLK